MSLIKKYLKKWLRKEIMADYWRIMDKILRQKKHPKMMWNVEDRYYEIVRRYKARVKK